MFLLSIPAILIMSVVSLVAVSLGGPIGGGIVAALVAMVVFSFIEQ